MHIRRVVNVALFCILMALVVSSQVFHRSFTADRTDRVIAQHAEMYCIRYCTPSESSKVQRNVNTLCNIECKHILSRHILRYTENVNLYRLRYKCQTRLEHSFNLCLAGSVQLPYGAGVETVLEYIGPQCDGPESFIRGRCELLLGSRLLG